MGSTYGVGRQTDPEVDELGPKNLECKVATQVVALAAGANSVSDRGCGLDGARDRADPWHVADHEVDARRPAVGVPPRSAGRIDMCQRIIARVPVRGSCGSQFWVNGHELCGGWVVVAGPEVVEAALGVLVLACEEQ